MFAFDAATGEAGLEYATARCAGIEPGCSPAQSAAVTAIPGVVFSGSLDGHLRAYATGRRPDRLGHGHGARISDGERREGQRRLD